MDETEKTRLRREFYAAAERSRAEFQRTGIAYALEDVMKYCRAIASGKKARMPKPIRIPTSKR